MGLQGGPRMEFRVVLNKIFSFCFYYIENGPLDELLSN